MEHCHDAIGAYYGAPAQPFFDVRGRGGDQLDVFLRRRLSAARRFVFLLYDYLRLIRLRFFTSSIATEDLFDCAEDLFDYFLDCVFLLPRLR